MKRNLSNNGVVTTDFHYHADDTFTINSYQDVEPVLDQNKRLQNLNDGYSPSREFRRLASIPLVVWQQWQKEGMPRFGYERKAWIRKKLADPDWQWLRTSSTPANRVSLSLKK